MDLLLLPDNASKLARVYRDAFAQAEHLLLVSAFLTNWHSDLKLGARCKTLRIIVGSDFGITRKQACRDLMSWLPPERNVNFLVADSIRGFHPKAMFWKVGRKHYALIGSSNLTHAARTSNFEANAKVEIDPRAFAKAEEWVHSISKESEVVSEKWLSTYTEKSNTRRGRSTKKKTTNSGKAVALVLPKPAGSASAVRNRREQLRNHQGARKGLLDLFDRCARASISNEEFYEALPAHWSDDVGNRLQGKGWERLGKSSDFQQLACSFLAIQQARPTRRDDVVRQQLDHLRRTGNPSRKAFLSEMLCLEFPDMYPVLNEPLIEYLRHSQVKEPRGVHEGATYVDVAQRLRHAILQSPNHPAKNIAELDTVLWKKYRRR